METEAVNKDLILVATFDGKTVYPVKGTPEFKKWKGVHCDYEHFMLKYDIDWSWLIPVWAKFVNAKDSLTNPYKRDFYLGVDTNDISKSFNALVSGIKELIKQSSIL